MAEERPNVPTASRETSYVRRKVILPKYRKRLIQVLTEKLSNKSEASKFLMSLPCAKEGIPSACLVRVFNFEGIPVVIKGTLGIEKHGYNPGWVRRDVYNHIKTFRGERAPKNYLLRLPQLYCQVGDYLVMEAVENKTREMMRDPQRSPELITAFRELKDNLSELAKDSEMRRPLQAHHFMAAGILK